MKPLTLFSCLILASASQAFAQSTSTSPSFVLLHAPAGDLAGGGRVANASGTVVAEISVGDAASGAVSAGTAAGVQTKGNLIGQLTDPRTVTVAASPTTINEGGTRQLTPTATLDDATTLPLTGLVLWTFGAPISTIDALTAVATASPVFQNTPRQVTATFRGVSGSLSLTVLNVSLDNYFQYAGDGMDDAWQVSNFGLPPNANAGPNANGDGDLFNNFLEFAFGTDPNNAASGSGVIAHANGLLTMRGQPTTSMVNTPNGVDFRAVFGRRKNYLALGLNYIVQFSDEDLSLFQNSTATPVIVASDDEFDVVTVRYPFFLSTGKKAQFFRVQVTGP